MNKWQIICPLLLLGIVALAFTSVTGFRNHRHYIRSQADVIGRELITATNSPRLVQLGLDLQKRLSGFLGSPAKVIEVRLGDEPKPIGNGRASCRLILENEKGEALGIRLRYDSNSEKFHVLGHWTISK